MSNDSTLMTLLTGAAIGACIGILYAPEEGSKTRKKIKQKAVETKHDWESRIYRATEELTQTADTKENSGNRYCSHRCIKRYDWNRGIEYC